MSFIYLASPYSNYHAKIREERYELVCGATAKLMAEQREIIYSPIVHCHEIAQKYSLPKDFEFWKKHNFGMLAKASKLYILSIDGWRESKGVQAEFELAFQLSISRFIVNETTLETSPVLGYALISSDCDIP